MEEQVWRLHPLPYRLLMCTSVTSSLRLLLWLLSLLSLSGLAAQEADYLRVRLNLVRAAAAPDAPVERWCKAGDHLGCRIGSLSIARKRGEWTTFDSLLALRPPKGTAATLMPYIYIERLLGLLERGQLDENLALGDSLLQAMPRAPTSLRAAISGQRGLIYLYRGDYPAAMTAMLETRRLYKKANDRLGLGQTDHNIAMVHGATKGYAEALRSYRRAIAEFERLELPEQPQVYFNVGNVYALWQRNDSARYFYHRALDVADSDRSRGAIYNAIGAVYVDDIEAHSAGVQAAPTDSAAYYLRAALQLRRSAADTRGRAHTQLNLAKYFFAVEQFDSSRYHATVSLAVADSLELLDVKKDLFALMAHLEARAERADSAVAYARRGARLGDSLLGAEQMRNFLAIVTGTEPAGEPARPLQRPLLAGGLGLALIIGAFVWRHRARRVENEETLVAATADSDADANHDRQSTHLEKGLAVGAQDSELAISTLRKPDVRAPSVEVHSKERESVGAASQPHVEEVPVSRAVAAERELAEVRRELVATRLELASDEAFYRDLLGYLDQLRPDPDQETLRRLRSSINQHQQFHSNWRDTMTHFRSVQPTFYEELRKRSDSLTPGDVRHAAFVRLGLSAKEVAGMLHVKYTTIEMSRYRLKKKLGLGKDVDLYSFLLSL